MAAGKGKVTGIDEARVAHVEHMAQPATDADRRVQAIYAAVSQLLPPELVVKP